MIDISGKLSELFKNSNNIEINITDRLCQTMLNTPITDGKGKVIGSIVDYDLEGDRWFGVLYKKEYAELQVNNKVFCCNGIVIE